MYFIISDEIFNTKYVHINFYFVFKLKYGKMLGELIINLYTNIEFANDLQKRLTE